MIAAIKANPKTEPASGTDQLGIAGRQGRRSLDFRLDRHCYPSCPIPKTWKSARNPKFLVVVQIEQEKHCGSGELPPILPRTQTAHSSSPQAKTKLSFPS